MRKAANVGFHIHTNMHVTHAHHHHKNKKNILREEKIIIKLIIVEWMEQKTCTKFLKIKCAKCKRPPHWTGKIKTTDKQISFCQSTGHSIP